MLVVLLKLIFVTSVLVWGVTISTQEHMIFYGVREWANKKLDEGYGVFKALVLCPWCLPSIWSLVAYFFCLISGIITYHWKIFTLYPLVVGGASMLSGNGWSLYELIDAKTEFYKNINDSNYGNEKEGSSEESSTEKSSHENY